MSEFYKQSKPFQPLPEPSAECLLSANSADEKGFVRLRVGKTTVYQHRHIYKVFNGIDKDVMKDLIITPTCGRYDCINPEHLIARSKATMNYTLLSSISATNKPNRLN